ncbi:FtsX-like permease family protein [Tumidithrix elongata RA019]|uniref:FtsX-like permease family protein n=1 Tax=Tumidithrix elongata BACA0141 TaxID=2716417 RepID=A0AAW9PSN3_9CYAN|nr:FtsX-like permease family protein [Tumidithrix elongata RA019]
MIFAVPLAWLQLTYEKSRLLVAIAGITFAVVLMFMQVGFQDALFTSAIRLQSSLVGDVVLISPQSTNLVGMRNFSQRRMYQTLRYEGVESVNALYIGLSAWKVKEDPAGKTRNILVLGANPAANVFKMPGTVEGMSQVQQQDVILFDRSSRIEFGPIVSECGVDALKTLYTAEAFQCKNIVTREIDNRKIKIGGLFELGSSFAADGAIITSDTNFLRILDKRKAGLINVALINLKPNASPFNTIADIVKGLPGETVVLTKKGHLKADGKRVKQVPSDPDRVAIDKKDLTLDDIKEAADVAVDDTRILTMEGFRNFEKSYWQKSTAIGFIFTLGTIMGFIVGIVIVYQILYTDVSDHMAEYATLKAMGYSNFYLSKVVIQEAFALSFLGFIPGLIICTLLYDLTRNATRLPLSMNSDNWWKVWFVLTLTVVMCCISGFISLRKVHSADPAEIFG